jgi:hypothetical protein
MQKRRRSSSVELVKVDDNGITVQYNEKMYYVHTHGKDYAHFFEDSDLEIDVYHNFENRAMIHVKNIRLNEDVLRQEINPLEFKDEWVKDD